jgi:hypothetical protein
MPSASAMAMPRNSVAICSPAAAGLRSAPDRKLPARGPRDAGAAHADAGEARADELSHVRDIAFHVCLL